MSIRQMLILENKENNLSKDYKLVFILAILFIPAEKIKAKIDYDQEEIYINSFYIY